MIAPDPQDVTLYIPARDAARTLGQVIDSVAAQTVTPAELVIVSDLRSADDTCRIAARSGARVVEQTRGRLGHTRNIAISACRTRWLASVDADARLEPSWLEHLLEAAGKPSPHGPLAAVGGRTEEDLLTDADRWRAVNLPHNWGPAAFDNPFMLVSEMMADVAALRAVGGYRPDLQAYEDSDLCQRLRHAGYTLRYQPDAVAHHNRRDSLTGVLDLRWKYAAYRQRDRLDNLPGLMAKFAVNRTYCLQSLSQTLHSQHADVAGLSIFLWFHHARRDLMAVLDKWPLMDAFDRSACLSALEWTLAESLLEPWAALVEPMSAALDVEFAAAVHNHDHTGLAATGGFGDYLRAAHESTRELLASLPGALIKPLINSARRIAFANTADDFSLDWSTLPISPSQSAQLQNVSDQPAWNWQVDGGYFLAALGRSARDPTTIDHGAVLACERPAQNGSAELSGDDHNAVILLPHLETASDPANVLRHALQNASAAIIGYQTPTTFIAAVPILQPRDLAALCAEAGLEIRHFFTRAGLTRLCVARPAPAPVALAATGSIASAARIDPSPVLSRTR